MESAENTRPVRVWCDGCFDLVHYGHANSLRQAKAMGDVLVVGVHNDNDIKAFKGPPVFTEQERYRMVRGIKWVDEVVEGSTYWPDTSTLLQYNCDFATHGDDISVATDGRDPYQALKDAGKLKLFQRTQGVSTTDIVGRMLLMTKEHHTPEEVTRNLCGTGGEVGEAWKKGKATQPPDSPFLQTSRKILQFADANEPKPGDRIVYVSGDWDLLHPGHLEFLEAAHKEGDYLIVGIHSDKVCNEKKQGNYPIMNLQERTLSLLACKFVSEVIIGAPFAVSEDLMKQMKVDLVCHGWTDVVDEISGDPFTVPKNQGKFKVIDTGNRLTTGTVIQRIIEHRMEFTLRNAKKSQREESFQAN